MAKNKNNGNETNALNIQASSIDENTFFMMDFDELNEHPTSSKGCIAYNSMVHVLNGKHECLIEDDEEHDGVEQVEIGDCFLDIPIPPSLIPEDPQTYFGGYYFSNQKFQLVSFPQMYGTIHSVLKESSDLTIFVTQDIELIDKIQGTCPEFFNYQHSYSLDGNLYIYFIDKAGEGFGNKNQIALNLKNCHVENISKGFEAFVSPKGLKDILSWSTVVNTFETITGEKLSFSLPC